MASRMDKVNNLLKKELGQIIAQEIDLSPGTLVTITEVSTSRDLHFAKVKTSIYPKKQEEKIIALLNKNSYLFQNILSKRVELKFLPKLSFIIDIGLNKQEAIDTLLEEIKDDNRT